MSDVIIGIPARNAAPTIERAVRSAMTQGGHPILLIDDWSTDDTVGIARRVAGRRLRVVRPPVHKTLGYARQVGIEAAAAPYLVWLDGDDELLPGRVERMLECFRARSADIVTDGVEIVDGATSAVQCVATVPSFLSRRSPLVRQFERNYLPGSAMIGVRVAFARSVTYDPDQRAAEDSDFLLRAAFNEPRVCLLEEPGYRMYAYPTSLSRNIESQREMVRRALFKHRYDDVRRLLDVNLYRPAIARWTLVSMATFRDEYDVALGFLSDVERSTADPDEVLEPDGPNPYPEGWRQAFHKGTLLLLTGRVALAIDALELAETRRPSAEGANNLGVAYARTGRIPYARAAFEQALDRFPTFLDARLNLEQPSVADRITRHPLRFHRIRDDYVPANAFGAARAFSASL